MKNKTDLVRGWLRKAGSDVVVMQASQKAGALDAACFHAQQAVEKYLKAYLFHLDLPFPFTRNLVKLLDHCATADAAFREMIPLAAPLTPYAVELRYDAEFWPSASAAQEACNSALAVRDFVLARLPPDLLQNTP